VIEFIAHDFWSAAWVIALFATGLIVAAKGNKTMLACLAAMIVNWIFTRSIVFWDLPNIYWIANDLVTTFALALCGKETANRACAALFAIIVAFDLNLWLDVFDYTPVTAVWDLLGYMILIIMIGASLNGSKRAKWNTYHMAGSGSLSAIPLRRL
jgi:hypothetical protein